VNVANRANGGGNAASSVTTTIGERMRGNEQIVPA
jgi:hypothetical protein